MKPKERALLLYAKNSEDYNLRICFGKMQQLDHNKHHWKVVSQMLKKLYKYDSI
jgi:hypothetical protein